jgi:predicted RND superfamily exporter protein
MALAVIAALTLLFAAFIPRLAFKTSIHDLIIEDLPENVQYESFKAVFGSEEIIRIVVACKDVFDPLNFQKIAQLEEAGKKDQRRSAGHRIGRYQECGGPVR